MGDPLARFYAICYGQERGYKRKHILNKERNQQSINKNKTKRRLTLFLSTTTTTPLHAFQA